MADASEDRRVLATYGSRRDADAAAERARGEGLDVSVDSERDERSVMRAEMRDETEAAVVGAGNVGPFTKGMTRGIVFWVPILGAIGTVIGAILGSLIWGSSTLGTVGGAVVGGVIGAVAGGTAGFVAGGFVRPRQEGEGGEMDAEKGTVVSIRVRTPEEAERARAVLERGDPMRVDEVAEGGWPVAPSSDEKTRPVRGD